MDVGGAVARRLQRKPAASATIRCESVAPLLNVYGVANTDPLTGSIVLGQGMDRVFDDVKMTIDADVGSSGMMM